MREVKDEREREREREREEGEGRNQTVTKKIVDRSHTGLIGPGQTKIFLFIGRGFFV